MRGKLFFVAFLTGVILAPAGASAQQKTADAASERHRPLLGEVPADRTRRIRCAFR